MENTKQITDFLKRFNLYNETHINSGDAIIYSYGGNPRLSGTIKFICTEKQGVFFQTTIITDEAMYDKCIEMTNKYKGSEINLFNPIPLFYSSYGSNGLIHVKLLLDDSTKDDVDEILKLIEVTEK